MPVHSDINDGVLHLTVDGDHTASELGRVGAEGLAAWTGGALPVLLDLSGAAGLTGASPEGLRETAAFLDEHRTRVGRVAILAPSAVAAGLIEAGDGFSGPGALEVDAFLTRADALAWLGGDG